MLKLTRHIFGWTADPRAMDYYERTLFNSRLGTQDAEGLKSYFLPLGGGYWKYYHSPFDSFWCCTEPAWKNLPSSAIRFTITMSGIVCQPFHRLRVELA